MYGNGQGVSQDHTKAHALYNLAGMKGNATAVRNRDIAAKLMTPRSKLLTHKNWREIVWRVTSKAVNIDGRLISMRALLVQ
jgi:TPR repeat protein